MVFIVALYVSWCRRLEAMPGIKPQLYADNLKCSAVCPNALCGAARFTAAYARSVGEDMSPGKCVLVSTSMAVRKSMKLWDVSSDGKPWKVELDVRDLRGHLGFTKRRGLGHSLDGSRMLRMALLLLVRFPLGFGLNWAWFGSKYLPAGLHAAEASHVSASSLSAFRASIVRSV